MHQNHDDSMLQANGSRQADQRFARQLRALAHPSRLAIVRQLAERDRCCCNDFCDCLDLAQSTISQHLEQLREAGLVSRQSDGTRSLFWLERDSLDQLSEAIEAIAIARRPAETKGGQE
jgi:ArsR family transcriptional regulator